jgi:AraC-like DNA-binding protein/quercetin dioxygenase-like cupin family protein
MHRSAAATMNWSPVEAPAGEPPPAPMTVRVQSLAARSYFPEHRHEWAQVVYAISGVLTVAVAGRSFVISPEQGVWLPTGIPHRVGTLHGAEFRSLWIASSEMERLPGEPAVFNVSLLLRALIVEAATLEGHRRGNSYADRVTQLILDQLRQAPPLPSALPWPHGETLNRLCETLYTDPTNARSVDEWGKELGMSGRTLGRRFEADIGMSLRSWRRRMRLFKAIEMLGGGMDVTRTALDLGYGSPSAFIYAFRTAMGTSPYAYMRSGATKASS